MNHKKHYNLLILKAQQRIYNSQDIYEKHHIVPRSMGGSNSKENIVSLTPKEHYIAHALLFYIHKNSSMAHAWFMMCSDPSRKYKRYTSRLYDISKKYYKYYRSEKQKGSNNTNYGRRWTQEQKQSLSNKKKGTMTGDANPSKRQEVKDKIVRSKLGENNPRSKEWLLQNKLTNEKIILKGGIVSFCRHNNTTYNALIKNTCQTWKLVN